MTKTIKLSPATAHEVAAWIMAAVALVFVLLFHLLPAVLAGLLVFELVHIITPMLARRFSNNKPSNVSKLWAVAILVVIIVSLLAFAGAGLVAFLDPIRVA